MARLLAALQAMWARATAAPQATRVGLLNTGELVLVDNFGHAQILSVQTTDVVRVVVAAGPRIAGSLITQHRPADHLHSEIHSLRRAP